MAISWGEFRQSVRDAFLNDIALPDDDEATLRWSDEELRVFVHRALEQFAQHHAAATSVSYTPATGVTYALPDNLYDAESLDVTGEVYIIRGDEPLTYLDPVRYTRHLDKRGGSGFYSVQQSPARLKVTLVQAGPESPQSP